ncbi:MAG: hypothetical protein JXP73_07680 [Deltaproteobacteria bacterium]|nr:hypothetical protein [Deltaproteobacteria bacterium]
MTIRTSSLAAAVIAGMLVASAAARADSDLVKNWPARNGDLEGVGQEVVVVPPNQEVRFRIGDPANTVPYPLVVLDVFSYPAGTLLGEGRWEDAGDNARVPVLLPDGGKVWVIVRVANSDPSYHSHVPLAASDDGGATWVSLGQYNIWGQPRIIPAGGLRRGTVVSTVEEPEGAGGASDTVLMVLEDDRAMYFDDDMGIDRMSRLTTGADCGTLGTCSILAARRTNRLSDRSSCSFPGFDVRPGTTTVVWDEWVGESGHDMDNDGLSDALEGVMGTYDSDDDFDGDGIKDGWEVLGIYDFDDQRPKDFCRRNLLNFPYYGADPIRQDIFVQIAWLARCIEPDPNVCAPGHPSSPPGVVDKDELQWSKDDAKEFVQIFAPDFRAHVDIGPWSGVPDTYDYGDWGGSGRLPDSMTVDSIEGDPAYEWCGFSQAEGESYHPAGLAFCQGFGQPVKDTENHLCKGTDSPRYGYFSHMLINGLAAWGWGGMAVGLCVKTTKGDGHTAVHELGHHFGLGHGGYEGLTCKPNYLSIMNYCPKEPDFGGPGSDFPAFSHGWLLSGSTDGTRDVVLNPGRLDESAGLGTSFPRNLPVLEYAKSDLFSLVDDDPQSPTYGGIDWNDDGEISGPGTLVQAYINRGLGTKNALGQPNGPWRGDASHIIDGDAQAFSTYDTIALYPADNNEFGFGLRYAFWDASVAVTEIGFLLPRRRAGCSGEFCEEFTSWWGTRTPKRVESMLVAEGLVVFQGDDGSLSYQGSINGHPANGTLRGAYSGPPAAVVAPMGSYSGGHPVIKVYAGSRVSGQPGLSRLYAQEFDLVTGKLLNGGWRAPQYWENGDTIYLPDDAAIGVTSGYVRDAAGAVTPVVVAAIPAWTWVQGKGRLQLAILRQTSSADGVVLDTWERSAIAAFGGLDSAVYEAGPGRIGLAYRPNGTADPGAGRYYLTWQNPITDDKGNTYQRPRISLTRGKKLPADQACQAAHNLCFPSFGDVRDGDDGRDWPAGVSLLYAGGHVRGAIGAGTGHGGNQYFPHMDGVIDQDQKDFDDYRHITRNLACALTTCPTLHDYP